MPVEEAVLVSVWLLVAVEEADVVGVLVPVEEAVLVSD